MLHDLRQSVRMLQRSPALAAVALFSIAITVGATAVVFAAVKAVLITPFPYADAGRLIQLRADDTRYPRSLADWVSLGDMADVAHANRTLEAVGTYRYSLCDLSGDGSTPPEALYGLRVSANMFPMLGVTPMLGRNILPQEDRPGRANEIILSYGLWARRFNSDPHVVGRAIEINGHATTIIGVMPAAFDFPMRLATTVRTPSGHMDFWAPLGIDPAALDRIVGSGGIARLRRGVSIEQARQDLLSISAELSRRYPLTNQYRLLHAAPLRGEMLGFAQTGLTLLMCAAAIFLLIGCANVANLLLARGLARSREIAVRMALGASRARVIRQLIIESLMLAILGGLAGYLLTTIAWGLLPSVAPMSIPRLASTRAGGSILAFSIAVSLINGLLFGIAPAIRASRRDPAASLHEPGMRGVAGPQRNRLRSSLVIAEVALAVVLVVVGGLLTASFVRLLRIDPGFDPDRTLASIVVPVTEQYQNPDRHALLFQHILENVRGIPGVEQVGTVDALPFSGENNGGVIGNGDPSSQAIAEVNRTSSGYLAALSVPLREGRWFGDDDMERSRDTALINDVAARQLWGNQSALGRRFCVYCDDAENRRWLRVIGIVGTIRHSRLDEPAAAQAYFAAGGLKQAQFLVVRTARPSPQLAKEIRKAVAAADPQQAVFLSATMSTLIGDSISDRRFVLTLLAATGSLALLLAAAGIYGVVSYLTSLRTQEIGIRIALGATARNVQLLIFRQGMWMACAGIATGLAGALIAVRLLSSVLTALASPDPMLIAICTATVTIAAALACLIPARRATRLDPMAALRA